MHEGGHGILGDHTPEGKKRAHRIIGFIIAALVGAAFVFWRVFG